MLPQVSNMQAVADDVSKWNKENNMDVNLMICFSKNPVFPSLITIDGDEIERVGQSKLLNDFKERIKSWDGPCDCSQWN